MSLGKYVIYCALGDTLLKSTRYANQYFEAATMVIASK